MIGGVELNLGPTGGNPNASTSEDFSSETGNYLYYLIFKEVYMTFWPLFVVNSFHFSSMKPFYIDSGGSRHVEKGGPKK